MSDVNNASRKAIANIKWLSSTMRGLTALADELGEVGDLQVVLNQKQVEIEGLRAQHKDVSAQIVRDMEAAKMSAAALVERANKEAAAIAARGEENLRHVEAVGEKTKEIRGQAQAKADALVAEASRHSASIILNAKTAESAIKESIKGLQENIAQLQKQEADARKAESVAKAHLDAINQQIAALKSKL